MMSNDPSSFGISLQLLPEVADELRQRDEERRRKQSLRQQERVSVSATKPTVVIEEEAFEGLDDNDEGEDLVIDGENWDDVLILPPHFKQKPHDEHDNDEAPSDENNKEQEEYETENGGNDGDDVEDDVSDALSVSPPLSLPVWMIDLQRLVGFQPLTAQEQEALKPQVQEAMWGDLTSVPIVSDFNDEKEPLDASACGGDEIPISQNFESRVAQLLETGAARHVDTEFLATQEAIHLRWIRLDYPSYFQHGGETLYVAKTERLWKRLLQPHPIPVVNRLLQHLRNCSRCLTWKVDLRRELMGLVRREEARLIEIQRTKELEDWKSGRRPKELEKLYDVRETLAHRTELARVRLSALHQQRDELVATELRQRRIQLEKGGGGGLEAFDFESTALFAFPTGFLGGSPWDEGKEDYEQVDDYIPFSEDEEYDPPMDHGEEDGVDVQSVNSRLESETSHEKKNIPADEEPEHDTRTADVTEESDLVKEGSTSMQQSDRKLQKKKIRQLQEAEREAEHQRKLERALRQEEDVTEACTTQEFKLAQAMVASLELRLSQVDELVETMQEEEWAHQEEEEEENNSAHETKQKSAKDSIASHRTQEHKISLLDQILAMVLGAIPPPLTGISTAEEHVQWLHSEHQCIVNDWKGYFGRLPPSLSLQQSNAPVSAQSQPTQLHKDERQQPESFQEEDIAAKRQALGISQLETECWDDGNSSDENYHDDKNNSERNKARLTTPTLVTQPQKKGFRPGCRID